jgi:hypothetical protein
MKQFLLLTVSSLLFLPISNAQTNSEKSSLFPYGDADGYQVLSTIIDGRAGKSKSDSGSILHRTISGQTFAGVRSQCSRSIPVEFQRALEDFDRNTGREFLLGRSFSIKKRYVLVGLSPANFSHAAEESQKKDPVGVFSVTPVGFDQTRTHAIAVIRYTERSGGTIGGDSTFYLLRKTDEGWKEVAEIPKCGRIY